MNDNQDEIFEQSKQIFECFLTYVTTDKSLDDIANEQKLRISKLKYYSSQMNWQNHRKEYKKQIQKEILDIRTQEQLQEIKQFLQYQKDINNKLTNIANNILIKVEQQLNSINLNNLSVNNLINLLSKISIVFENANDTNSRLLGLYKLLEIVDPIGKHPDKICTSFNQNQID